MPPIEFVVWVSRQTYPKSQVMPQIFLEGGYTGKKHLYLISSRRIRTKVKLVTPVHGPVTLKGCKWTEFAKENIGDRVRLLHFIQEGDDTWYVTGYDSHGHEFGGYQRIEGRYSRFQSCVWAKANKRQRIPGSFLTGLGQAGNIRIDVEAQMFTVPVHRVNVEGVNISNEYEIFNEVWELIKARLHLKAGMTVVFTKEVDTQFWMMAFNGDGSQHTNTHFFGATQLHEIQPKITHEDQGDDRMQHVCRWPVHRDHFGEYADAFYKRYSYIVVMKRLTVPADFLVHHPMHTYTHALMKHQNVEYMMDVRMEFHKEDPERTNHINIFGDWREFARDCRFAYDKMIRFKFMYLLSDFDGEATNTFPVFHVC